jgi:glycosyltransferase involved in cell wall biosynthesis
MEWSVDALRVNLGIEPGELAIFTIGRLARQKGLEYLIEALPRLADQFARPFKVFLAGDGPLRTELQRMVTDRGLEDKVVFLGFRKDVRQLLLACDLVVLPTLREGLSIALIEAMAAGKAIITTTIGSNKEATLNGEAALLIPPKSPAAIADAITQIVENAWMAARLATRAREIYLASYTDTHMLKAYRGIYEEVLSSRTFAVTADSQFEAQA